MKFTKKELAGIIKICDAIKTTDKNIIYRNIDLNTARKKVNEFYKTKVNEYRKASGLIIFESENGGYGEYNINTKTLAFRDAVSKMKDAREYDIIYEENGKRMTKLILANSRQDASARFKKQNPNARILIVKESFEE